MNILDEILINVICYLSGILTGIGIYHKCKNTHLTNDTDKENEKEKEYVTNSPLIVPSAPAYPVPPMNPDIMHTTPTKKQIVITTE